MATVNPFDQFDEPSTTGSQNPAAKPKAAAPNPFDQFDSHPVASAPAAPARPAPNPFDQFDPPKPAPVPSKYDPTEGMSGTDKFVAGIGSGMTSLYNGAKQLGAHGAVALGAPQRWADNADADVAEQASIDKPLLNTGTGWAGNIAGQIAATAPLGVVGGGARAATVAARALQAAKAGAVGGAIGAAAQPVVNPEGSFASQKLGQIGEGAALGGVGGGALSLGGDAAAAAINVAKLPFRMAAGKTVTQAAQEGAPASPARAFMDESDRLSQETGVPFTPGQSTGSKGLTAMEQRLRQNPNLSDQVFQGDKKATQALDDFVTRVFGNMSKEGRSTAETGDFVRNVIKDKISDIERQRSAMANQQYGAIRQQLGGRHLIQPDNLRAALSDIVADHGNIATPGAEALTRFANKTSDSALGDVNGLMNLRSYLSKVAGGQAKISGDGVDRKIASTLLGAIDNDLDANANALGGPVGDMLRSANQNYRNFSQQMDYLRQSPLGKMLGKDVTDTMTGGQYNTIPPEKIVARIRTMTPREALVTKNMMQDVSPDAWQAVKRSLVEDALNQARSAAPSSGANTLAMQPNKFVRALQGNTPNGHDWLGAVFEPKEVIKLKNAFDTALRLGDKTAYNFSGTAPMVEAAINRANWRDSLNPVKLAGMVASKVAGGFSNKRLASAMLNPDGRRLLLQLHDVSTGSNRHKELLGKLAAITAESPHDEPDEDGNGQN